MLVTLNEFTVPVNRSLTIFPGMANKKTEREEEGEKDSF